MDGQVDDLEALDAGLGDGEVLLECDICHVEKAPIDDTVVAGAPGGPQDHPHALRSARGAP